MLKFSRANAKLVKLEKIVGKLYSFSMLSGHKCPFAKDCLSKVVKVDGKSEIEDGKHTVFRCFSASQEAMFPSVYNARKYNQDMIASCGNDMNKMSDMISESIPKDAKTIRIHIGADFFTQNYFDAWLQVARNNPNILMYAYTKSLIFWVKRLNDIPDNLVLTASYGGHSDNLIQKHNLRNVTVVHEPEECKLVVKSRNKNKMPKGSKYAGMPIDHNDSFACLPKYKNVNFCLLVHGIMGKGTQAGKAVSILDGLGSYSKGK